MQRPWTGAGAEEYSDDDDAGYWREPVQGQVAFRQTELDLSDDEHSPGRSSLGYHRCALARRFLDFDVPQ